ncbi:uncharacterized protein LOC106156593 [Lingula anatina]|uniref:Uncharacterized protein LOC106156593 n=1 Tax=Lingula anatina TaxID=7574 RepID=A0A1S3HMS6_LINAN|nr:uncharacterized protein LOC106156593 [Lingula anatina]|eukprot:XP_013387368.1 uncharacterized protein LOC106156593 [Lingula anatina]
MYNSNLSHFALTHDSRKRTINGSLLNSPQYDFDTRHLPRLLRVIKILHGNLQKKKKNFTCLLLSSLHFSVPPKRSRSSTAPESTPNKRRASRTHPTPSTASTSSAGPSSASEKRPRVSKGKQLVRKSAPSSADTSSPSTSESSHSTPQPVDNQAIFNILKEMSQAMATLAANSVAPQSGQRNLPENPPPTPPSADTGIVSPQTNRYSTKSIPLHALVDDKLKDRIWGNEFVDMSLLLQDQSAQLPQPGDPLPLAMENNHGKITLVVSQGRRPQITSMSQWTTAFHTFMSVYTLKHPQEAPNLLKYAEDIRVLAGLRGDWLAYDRNFRANKERSGDPWEDTNWDLWNRALLNSRPNNNVQQFRPRGSFTSRQPFRKFPQGVCYKFHSGNHCRGDCTYDHKCFRCSGGTHPASQCPRSENRAAARPSYPSRANRNSPSTPQGPKNPSRPQQTQ